MKKKVIQLFVVIALACFATIVFAAENSAPSPDLRVVLLGNQHGKIRPCG